MDPAEDSRELLDVSLAEPPKRRVRMGLGLPVTTVMPRATAQQGITDTKAFDSGMISMGGGGG